MKTFLLASAISGILYLIARHFHVEASAGGDEYGSAGISFVFYVLSALVWFVFVLAALTGHTP